MSDPTIEQLRAARAEALARVADAEREARVVVQETPPPFVQQAGVDRFVASQMVASDIGHVALSDALDRLREWCANHGKCRPLPNKVLEAMICASLGDRSAIRRYKHSGGMRVIPGLHWRKAN